LLERLKHVYNQLTMASHEVIQVSRWNYNIIYCRRSNWCYERRLKNTKEVVYFYFSLRMMWR